MTQLELVDRSFHRQMSIDLIRAYLQDYGSARSLAGALGISAPALSQFLKPVYPAWAEAVSRSAPDAEADLAGFLIPTSTRAKEIAIQLSSDAERRDVLLHHLEAARPNRSVRDAAQRLRDVEEIGERMRRLGAVHETALLTNAAGQARASYARVWQIATELALHVDPMRHVLDHVQVLMYLHDAACVLNRADLALGYARQAMLLLGRATSVRDREYHERLRVNAALAEVVALNNLGLFRQAVTAMECAKTLPGYEHEPEYWLRSFLEQRLKAISGLPRFPMSEAEWLAEQAIALAPEQQGFAAGAEAYLVLAYVAHSSIQGTARSLRKASRRVDDLRGALVRETSSTLRQMRMLRALAAYDRARGDQRSLQEVVTRALRLSEKAGLLHQRAELTRLYGSPLERFSDTAQRSWRF